MIGRKRDGQIGEIRIDLLPVRVRETFDELTPEGLRALLIKICQAANQKNAKIAKVFSVSAKTIQRASKIEIPEMDRLHDRAAD